MAKDNSSADETTSRSAVASWSGYNYQGKVGIYVALKEIKELISEDSTTLDNFSIEYESPTGEDFDIKKGEEILSRHQVKATQGKSLSSYRNVIDINGTNSFDVRGVDENERYLHVSTEVEGWGLSQEDYERKYPNRNRKWVANLNNIQLYAYEKGEDQQNYCPIDEINNKCTGLIQEISKSLNSDSHTPLQSGEAKDIFLRILENLDGEITKAHQSRSQDSDERIYPTIRFKDIKDIITREDETSTDRHDERGCRRLKDKFICSCEKAVEDYILDNEDIDQAKIEGFKSIYKGIVRKSNEDFMDLIYNFSFHDTKDRSETDFDDIAIKEIIAEYIIGTGVEDINTDKFLFDQLPKEKHILSGIVAKENLSTSVKQRFKQFLPTSNNFRAWSSDQVIVNQFISETWNWDNEKFSITELNTDNLVSDPHLSHRFTRPDCMKFKSIKDAIKAKLAEKGNK
ncbi:MAG: ABC-three component system protein [bacterium]